MNDEGAQCLASALQQNKTLLQLYLRNSGMSTVGIQYLADALQQNRTLTLLTMDFRKDNQDIKYRINTMLQKNGQ